MGNPQMEAESKIPSSPDVSRDIVAARPGLTAISRGSASMQHYLHNRNELLHSQVAKLRIEEKYLLENVRGGMEMLAISQILSTVKDLSMQHEADMRPMSPSPLGLPSAGVWDRRSFVASG